MDLTALLSDVKTHLEHGAELAASHVPALLDLAGRIEADPLVQTAINLAVPDTTRNMLAQLLKLAEADAQQVAAAAEARAAAAAEEASRAANEGMVPPDPADPAAPAA